MTKSNQEREWSAAGNMNLNTRKFTGYERDATGLDYANARSYTSSWGRFIQADPLGSGYQGRTPDPIGAAKQDKPQTLNRYSYVSNDPINYTDPSGLLRAGPGNTGCICCEEFGSIPGGGGGGETCNQCLKREAENCVLAYNSKLKTIAAGELTCQTLCLAVLNPVLYFLCVGACVAAAAYLASAAKDDLKICTNNVRKNCPQCP